jgi:NHL repeat.
LYNNYNQLTMKTFSRWTVIISLYIVQLTFAQEYTKTLLGNGFSSPFSLYVDTSGTIYIPDYKNNQVKKWMLMEKIYNH